MTEESKSEDTLRIEISHFASSPTKQPRERNSKQDLKEENLNDNSMKISIERKSSKKSININVNELPTSERTGSSDGFQIKIEKSNTKKELKDTASSPIKSPSKSPIKSPTKSQKKRRNEEPNNIDPLPVAGSNERYDAYGNVIRKGNSKRYRVTFIDSVPKNKQNLIKIVDVECFKPFNVDVSQNTGTTHVKAKGCCSNGCIIY